MADLVITAANVIAAAGADVDRSGKSGGTITAGQVVYKDAASGQWLLADNNSATVAARTPGGIALNGASAGQPLAVHRSGPLTIGATLASGVAYYLSGNPGGICPVADLVTGMFPTVLGIAQSTTVLEVAINPSGVAL